MVRLLSPTEEREREDREREDRDDPEWLAEVLSASSNSLLNESTLHDTLDGRSRSEISNTMGDSMTSSRIGTDSCLLLEFFGLNSSSFFFGTFKW